MRAGMIAEDEDRDDVARRKHAMSASNQRCIANIYLLLYFLVIILLCIRFFYFSSRLFHELLASRSHCIDRTTAPS